MREVIQERQVAVTWKQFSLAIINNTPVALHLGRTVAEVSPHLFPEFEPYLRRALAGEATIGVEMRGPNPKQPGQLMTYLISYQPARDEVDEVIGVSVSVVDITPRKQAEEALTESEDHYRHTVELNPQIPWTPLIPKVPGVNPAGTGGVRGTFGRN